MASKPAPHQQPKGEAVAGVNRQQKKNVVAAGGEGRNRRALGDIGNLVTVRGNDARPQISRPITRSFCAQLLANAQAAAMADCNKDKKPLCVNPEKFHPAVAEAEAVKKVAQRKVAGSLNTNHVEVIVLSPDTEEVAKLTIEDKPEKQKREGEGSVKKKAPTLTSVLTARSKFACGVAIASKPEESVDIDAGDAHNELAEVEYVEDIYKFYKLVENESEPANYMEFQPEINGIMRAILIDWLIDVHQKFDLSAETLYLTINIIDRFLSVKIVPRKELQLVGISSTLVASKYEEIWPPEVNDLVCISDKAYSHQQVLVMEKTILGKLEWTLTVPTHFVFLARFIKASLSDKETENMVYFLAELGIMNYDILKFSPSMVAAAAVYAARCTLNKIPSWTVTLKLHTGFAEKQLLECAGLMAVLHSKAAENKLRTVYRKYSSPDRGAVALLSAAKSLLPSDCSK